MKRILCIIDSMGSGGAQRQMNCLMKLLYEKGYVVRLIYWVHLENDTYLADELRKLNIPCDRLPELNEKRTRLFRLGREIKQWKPTVVISYNSGASELLCMNHIVNRSYKLIVSERTITRHISKRTRLKMGLYRFADNIVPNSTTEADFIKNHFPKLGAKTLAIHNFVDTERFSLGDEGEKNFDPINALFVGRINVAKNIPNFINALKLVRDSGYTIHVDMYGNVQDKSIYDDAIAFVNENHLQDSIAFYSASTHIEDEYRSHNLFIMPSAWEGFPNVLCEAMSCGLPALASDVSDVANIMEDGINGYLMNPSSPEDMAKVIIKYCQLSFDERVLMAKASRYIIEKKFSKESFVQNYINLIEE